MTANEIALLLQTLQNIEQHLASLAASAQDIARLQQQRSDSPVRNAHHG